MKESQNIEFKPAWRDEYLKWICGFANARGGVIFIGKNDKGEVTGIANAQQLLETIPNRVRDILGIIVEVNLLSENGKDFLEIKVKAYPSPVNYKGQYHFCSGSTKQELKGAALDRFLLRKQGLNWDSVPAPDIDPGDFDSEAFNRFRAMALKSGRMEDSVMQDTEENIIENLMLKEGEHIKRAAALLFHKTPERFVTGAYIKIGFFRTDADLLYQDEIHGNLFAQAEKTLDLLLTKYLKAYISYEGIQRVEKYLFPRNALREALLNAVIHKDYSSGIPIQISVYEDKIYFWNNGRLPEDWTVERLLKKHPSHPYNPLIANAFFRTGLIEAWGRGIEKIHGECKQHGAPPPTFNYEPSGLMLLFKGNIPEKSTPATRKKSSLKSSEKTVRETVGKTVGKTVGEILQIIKNNPKITRDELSKLTGLSVRGVEWNLAKLKDEGKIQRIGPARGGHWEVLK